MAVEWGIASQSPQRLLPRPRECDAAYHKLVTAFVTSRDKNQENPPHVGYLEGIYFECPVQSPSFVGRSCKSIKPMSSNGMCHLKCT